MVKYLLLLLLLLLYFVLININIGGEVLKMELTQCSETLAFNTQRPGKYPEDNLSLLQHGESLKSRIYTVYLCLGTALHVLGGTSIHHQEIPPETCRAVFRYK